MASWRPRREHHFQPGVPAEVLGHDSESDFTEERSQIFINKNYNAYSLNFRMNSQATSLKDSQIRLRQLPSLNFDRRPSIVRWLKELPVYLSWESGVEGVSRKETAADPVLFRSEVGRDPIFTPSIVQRFDFTPSFRCR